MAEIKLEKKKTPFWPWLLVLIAAAAIIWIVVDNMDQGMETAGTDTLETQITEPADTGEEFAFVTFVNDSIDQLDMGREHEFTSQGINLLAQTLDNMADNYQNVTLNGKVDELNQTADEITQDPESVKHADKIKAAFTDAADIISSIQKEAAPDNNDLSSNIEQKAEAINTNEMTLDQKEEIKSFFTAAADAIDELSNREM